MPLQVQAPLDPQGAVRIPKLQVRGRDMPSRSSNGSPNSSSQNPRENNSASPKYDTSVSDLEPPSSWSPDSSPSRSRAASPDTPTNKRKRKERSSLLGFFSTKEPSQMALKEFAKQQKRQTIVKGQRSVTPGFHNQKLPRTVPKVNSKWDGMPNHFHYKEGKPWEKNQELMSQAKLSKKVSATSSISDVRGSSTESPPKPRIRDDDPLPDMPAPKSPKRTRIAHSATSSDAEPPPKQVKREMVHRTASYELPIPDDLRAALRRSWSESHIKFQPLDYLPGQEEDKPKKLGDVEQRPAEAVSAAPTKSEATPAKLEATPTKLEAAFVPIMESTANKRRAKGQRSPPPIITTATKFKSQQIGTRYPIDDSPVADYKPRDLDDQLPASTFVPSSDYHIPSFPIHIPEPSNHDLAEAPNPNSYIANGTMYSPATPVSPVSALSPISPNSPISPTSPVSPVSPVSADFLDMSTDDEKPLPPVPATRHVDSPTRSDTSRASSREEDNLEWPLPPKGIPNWPLPMNAGSVLVTSPTSPDANARPTTPKSNVFLAGEARELQIPNKQGLSKSQSALLSKSKPGANEAPPAPVPVTPPRNFSRSTPPRTPHSPQSPIQSLNSPKTGVTSAPSQSPSRPLLGQPGRAVSKGITLPSIPESDASSVLSIRLSGHITSSFRDDDEDEDNIPTPRASPSASPEPFGIMTPSSSKDIQGSGSVVKHKIEKSSPPIQQQGIEKLAHVRGPPLRVKDGILSKPIK